MLDFVGLEVQGALVTVHVKEDLRGSRDGSGRLKRMHAPQQREVGQRFQVIHVGAGEHEEVAQHPVAGPRLGQRRQAVEQHKRPASRLADGAADLRDELFEADGTLQLANRGPVARGGQRRVLRETEVEQPPAGTLRGPAVRRCKRREILDRIDLPHQVVAGQQTAEHSVQRGHPRAQM